MRRAGYPKGSEFLWEEHYVTYWDLTQRIYREEFDPRYDGEQKAGYPFCQEEATPPPKCDANYQYKKRVPSASRRPWRRSPWTAT
jgi:hypothetical protein